MEYEFTLKFKLHPTDANHDELVERLGAAGCTDALVGLGVTGHLGLEFVREAESAKEAVLSAMAEVKGAIPSAKLVEAGPDFVGLTDVADLVGVSRQNMRKLMVTHAETFPAPVYSGSSSVWHLALILEFLLERQYTLTQAMVEVAQTAMRVNLVKEAALVGNKAADDSRYALAA
jgi:predicted DNA-binding transcriptional regulator AlpA